MAYEQVTGTLGPERDDLLHAITATTISNANRPKGRAPSRVTSFMPKWDRRQSWEDQLQIVRDLNRRMGGTDRTTRKG